MTVADSAYAATHGQRVGSAVPIAGARFTVIGIVRQAAGSNAPDLYIPMARAQALANLGGQVNIVYVRAASAAAVGAATGEISGSCLGTGDQLGQPGQRGGRIAADHRALARSPAT